MEEVEKIPQRPVAGAQTSKDERRVEMRKRSLGTSGAHEVHGERRRLSFGPIDGLNFAGGKRERRVSAEASDLLGRNCKAADGLAIRRETFKQTDSLEEFEAVRLFAELLLDFRKIYRRITSPARGGH
jgi:hypothetical protein